MKTLTEGLALQSQGGGAFSAFADPAFEANTGMFGGWTAAILLKAALAGEEATGTPTALTVNFIRRVEPGATIRIRTALLGGGKSLRHWRAEIFGADEALCAAASVVTATRRDSDRFVERKRPDAPDPLSLPLFHPPGPFGDSVDVRPVYGFPPYRRPDTRTISFIRDQHGAPVDWPRLAYFSDVAPPRVFLIGDAPRPSSTITLSVNFYATQDELTAVGANFLLSEVAGIRAEASVWGHAMTLWSPDGVILATSEQLGWFR